MYMATTDIGGERFLGTEEAAQFANMGPALFRSLVRQGRIPVIRPTLTKWIFSQRHLQDALYEMEEGGPGDLVLFLWRIFHGPFFSLLKNGLHYFSAKKGTF